MCELSVGCWKLEQLYRAVARRVQLLLAGRLRVQMSKKKWKFKKLCRLKMNPNLAKCLAMSRLRHSCSKMAIASTREGRNDEVVKRESSKTMSVDSPVTRTVRDDPDLMRARCAEVWCERAIAVRS